MQPNSCYLRCGNNKAYNLGFKNDARNLLTSTYTVRKYQYFNNFVDIIGQDAGIIHQGNTVIDKF